MNRSDRPNRPDHHLIRLLAPALLLGAAACSPPVQPGEGEGEVAFSEQIGRELGGTSFLSADGQAGQGTPGEGEGEGEGEAAPDAGAGEDDGSREVVEGDIYRVLPGGLLANLNAYRGLQLLDVSDASAPSIIGRLPISGTPVEMYVNGDRVYILMNDWHGYYGVRDDLASLGQVSGGVVASVDISNPAEPVLLDQAVVPGWIQRSRLTKGNVSAALYVVGSRYDYVEHDDGSAEWGTRTTVKSFDVAGGTLAAQSELDLGGYVTDIQATPRALLVARHDWSWNTNELQGSRVSLIDISSPDGVMVEGDEVRAAGYVQNQFRMDLHDDVLRIASGAMWGGSGTNHIETFDASDLGNVVALDHVTYGDGEQLYATLFLADKAFAVTYLMVDPFHAFSIDADGMLEEQSEFVVSGWNDFFRPAFDESRLIGIGVNDEQGRSMSVSLYDITDLTSAEPLVARAEVEADYSWSEASWDHRAFSVIEGAAAEVGPGGEEETGLVLLPFSGWSDEHDSYTAAVQIFTFSDSSLTRRGLMVHGTPVRRSFAVTGETTGNLSEAELSLFATSDPAAPAEQGRVELAPDYSDVLVFGEHAARLKRRATYYGGWYGGQDVPDSVVEIISRDQHADTAAPIASIDVPAHAQLHASGDLLVSVARSVTDWSQYPYVYTTDIKVIDLSDPTVPVLAGELSTDRITPVGYGYGYGYECFDCGWGSSSGSQGEVAAVPGGLAFLERTPQDEIVGTEEVCTTWPRHGYTCGDNGTCTYVEGSIRCSSLDGAPEVCSGSFRRCYSDDDGAWECEHVSPDDLQTDTSCWTGERHRYWQSLSLEVLDLRDPAAPALLDTVALPAADEGVGMVADGANVWLSYKRPAEVPGSSLPYVRYFARRLSLGDLDAPHLGASVNVPGALLAASGNVLYTRDYLWGEQILETSVNRLTVSSNVATLDALHTFDQQLVERVMLDGAGQVLVTHRLAWPFVETAEDSAARLSILDADDSLAPRSEVLVDSWAELREARAGRALFQVPGGLLVMNVADPDSPYAQAFHALRGWPQAVRLDGDAVLVPAGRFGIYELGLDAFNLLPPM